MNSVAAILDYFVLYRYSLILALAAAAGICNFMACCSYLEIPSYRCAAAALVTVLLSLPLSRLIYWYGRPDSFSSFSQALMVPYTEAFALPGVMVSAVLSVLAMGRQDERTKMLDCMSVAGCASLFLGRLGYFFSEKDRGQVMLHFTSLPWSYPVANGSGHLEYRFATFLFQALAAAVLGIFLAIVFFRKKNRHGDTAILFVLFYSACQIILDSTRYDPLSLPSNGFVSIVQVLSAIALVSVILLLNTRSVKILGFKKWMVPLWIFLVSLFAGVGYMEYYVQRHGRHAVFAYSAMGIYLAAIVDIGLLLWYLTQPHVTKHQQKQRPAR